MRSVFFIILFLCVFSLPLLAQGQWDWCKDFSGGLNLTDMPTQLEHNEALVLRNVVIVGESLQKRKDFAVLSTKFSDDGVRELFSYYNKTGSVKHIIAIAGENAFFKLQDLSSPYFLMMGTDLTGGYVTTTSGDIRVVMADSGALSYYDNLNFSDWNTNINEVFYGVDSFWLSTNSDADTLFLHTNAASTGTYSMQMSPVMADNHVDFETWHNTCFLADGSAPVKRWYGTAFKAEEATLYYIKLDSFLVDTVTQVHGNEFKFDIGSISCSWTQLRTYSGGRYCVVWADSDAVGLGDNLYLSKPIPMVHAASGEAYITGIDTAFYYNPTKWNIDRGDWVFITYPAKTAFCYYSVVDSGNFTSIDTLDTLTQVFQQYMLLDLCDNTKSWDYSVYNFGGYFLCFDNPATYGTAWHHFRVAAEDTILRWSSGWTVDVNPIVTCTTSQDYWIIKAQYGDYGTMPSSRFVKQQANVLWCAGYADNPNRVDVSDVGVDSIFDPTNIFNVYGEDGDEITGVFDIQNYLYFVKSDGIVQVVGNDVADMSQSPVVYDFGMKSPGSMFHFRAGFIGFNEEGFFSFNGSVPTPISEKIISVLHDSLNLSAIDAIRGVDAGRWMAIALPFGTSTTNNRLFMLDVVSQAWFEWTGINAGALLMKKQVSGSDTLLYGSADSGMVFRYADYDDDYDFEYISGFYDKFNNPTMEKRVFKIAVQAAFDYGDSIAVSLFLDGDMSDTIQTDTLVSSTPAHISSDYLIDTDGVRGNWYAIGIRSLSLDTLRLTRVGWNVDIVREIRP